MSRIQGRRDRLANMLSRSGASPSVVARMLLKGSYEADPPEDWVQRWDCLLHRWDSAQRALWRELGWDGPVDYGTLEARVQERRKRYSPDDGSEYPHHIIRIPTADNGEGLDSWPVKWPREDPALESLELYVDSMESSLGYAEVDAVAFLLCDRRYTPPWIRLRWDCVPATGIRFTIEVGSADVSGKELASVYSDAVATALGTERGKRVNFQTFAIALHDLDGRARGKSNRQRWQEWQEYAEPRGLETYPDGEGTGTLGERSYRTTVNRALKRMPWLHALVADSGTEVE